MAERIPGAEFVELDGRDHIWFADPGQIVTEVERFLRGIWERGEWDVVERDRVPRHRPLHRHRRFDREGGGTR
jgi:hypothetical protein